MSSCMIEQRARTETAADEIGSIEGVLGIDVIEPADSESNRFELEATMRGGGVPSAVSGVLSAYELELRESQPQGDHWEFRAVAE